jgi:diguanylate cyclase (GGDEF)-like protein
MSYKVLQKTFAFVVIAAGGVALVWAFTKLNYDKIDLGFLLLTIFTLTIASRMQLHFPRSNLVFTFADAMIFLAFLFYGGEFAIILASLEFLTNSVRIKSRKADFHSSTIFFNVGVIALSTAVTYISYLSLFPYLQKIGQQAGFATSAYLLSVLGTMALIQFFVNSTLVAGYFAFRSEKKFWKIWLDQMLPGSITHIAGAGLAGIIYKLIVYADPVATIVTSIAVGLAYFTYRKSIGEINHSFETAEKAERAKAESERQRAEQAEDHVKQLNAYLKKQESISDALRKSKEAFQYSAMHDSLTDVANRAFLLEQLKSSIEKARGEEQTNFSVLFMDIKRFKNINDSLGHSIGDKMLIMVAKRLQGAVRDHDVVARLGGDEFAVILNDIVSPAENIRFAKTIHQKISQPFILQGNKVFISLHIGIAPSDAEYDHPEEILRDADIAMHHAKQEEVPIAVFDKELRARVVNAVKIESDLRFAVQRKELVLFYQPIVSLEEGKLAGFEALVRWNHPERGLVPPNDFIPIAEESGLIIPMTGWILNEACRQISQWQKLPGVDKNMMVSVNLSGRHLSELSLVGDVRKVLEKHQLDPDSLKLEITESTAMQNIEITVDSLTKLKELGVRLSMDDFGTGYSSLSQLHRLPFDTLKIDRSFVSNVKEDGEDGEILWTIISLAKTLKLKIIAEGIETAGQLQILRRLECDFGQGYLLSKPLPKEEMEALMLEKTSWFPESVLLQDLSRDLPAQNLDADNQLRIF